MIRVLQNIIYMIPDELITDIIINYTQESGVRQLERIIRKLCSKAARTFVEENNISLTLIKKICITYLGPRKFIEDESAKKIKLASPMACMDCIRRRNDQN